MSKTKKQTFLQGILILMFSQVIVKILGLIYKLYLTNKNDFGDTGNAIYSSGFQIYALLLTVSSVGVPNAVSKLISEKVSVGDENGANKIFKISFVIFATIGLINSIFLYIFAKYIANDLLQIPQAELTLKALSPAIFFVSTLSVFRGYFNAKGNMKPTANSQTIEQFAKTILTIIIVECICCYQIKNKTEIMAAGANLATTIATVVSFLYLSVYYKKYKTKKIHNYIYNEETTYNIIKKIFIVSMPITITAILGTINKNIDSITVVRCLKNFLSESEATRQYGILSGKVDALVTLPMSLNMAISTSLVPAISAAKANKNLENIKKKVNYSLAVTMLIALPSSIGMIIFANPILQLLFPNASAGTHIFQASAMSIIFILVNQTITSILQGMGEQLIPVFSLAIGVILKLIINVVLIPINPTELAIGGITGASIGTIICYLTAMFINVYKLKKIVNIKLSKKQIIIKPLICTTIMICTAYILYNLLNNLMKTRISIIFSIFGGIIIYIFMIYISKIFKNEYIPKTLVH